VAVVPFTTSTLATTSPCETAAGPGGRRHDPSDNGKSPVLDYEAILLGYVGRMAVLWDNGWFELFTSEAIELQPVRSV
jgi:hypothetical protein